MEETNRIARTMYISGITLAALGLIVGIYFGAEYESFMFFIYSLITSFIVGLLLIGFSQVINLLEDIKHNTENTNKMMKQSSTNLNNYNDSNVKYKKLIYDLSKNIDVQISGKAKSDEGQLNINHETLVSIAINSQNLVVSSISSTLLTIPTKKIMTCYYNPNNTLELIYLDEYGSDRKLQFAPSAYDAKDIVELIRSIK